MKDAQEPNEIISACDDHLPIDCGHDDCEKFSDRDENNGIRTTTCFNRTWRYNKDGWIKNKRGCIRPVDNIRGLQSKPKQMI